jgi:ABC-type transport system involved in multi-copper enzyme maturation permease subunit
MFRSVAAVMRYELITTSRRGRYFLARLVYGLVLLFLLFLNFAQWEAMYPRGGTIDEVRAFAESTFFKFGQAQGIAILCLIPALVAGVIADEYQRKTLHYLLASRLSSAEIVLGKLGGRLMQIGMFVALGLPIVCLLGLLYGGLNPVNVAMVYGGSFTMVLFVSGLSILISTLARRPREAILAAYSVEATWLIGSPALRPFAGYLGWPLEWVESVNSWLYVSNPAVIWDSNGSFVWIGHRWTMTVQEAFFWMVGLQCVFGLLFLMLAIVGLRPLRGSSWPGGRPQTGWFTRLSARFQAAVNARMATILTRNQMLIAPTNRPPCGDHPMLWKERYSSLGGSLRWLGSRPVAIFFAVLLGCYLMDVVRPLLSESLLHGSHSSARTRAALNHELQAVCTLLTFVGMLIIAATAAVSISGEREQDTWVSLKGTLLAPREVVYAKQFGAVWNARWVGLALLVLWGVGLILRALHPFGVLSAALLSALIAWLTAAMGVFLSQRARNSTRALLMTVVCVLVVVGWWVLGALAASLLAPDDVDRLLSGSWPLGSYLLGLGLVFILVTLAALGLTLITVFQLGRSWTE